MSECSKAVCRHRSQHVVTALLCFQSALPLPCDVMKLVVRLPPSQIPLSCRAQPAQIAENRNRQTNETKSFSVYTHIILIQMKQHPLIKSFSLTGLVSLNMNLQTEKKITAGADKTVTFVA